MRKTKKQQQPRRRNKVDRLVRGIVKDFLINSNPDYTGVDLKMRVEGWLRDNKFYYNFTPRTYQNIKNELIAEGLTRPVDKEWTLWALVSYPIGAESINKVIEIHRVLKKYDKYLTIRRAKWIARLYPILFPILKSQYPNEKDSELDLILLQIASFYTRLEQISENPADKEKIVDREVIDSKDLDQVFIIDQNLTFEAVLREWIRTFLPHLEVDTLSINTENTEQFPLLEILSQSSLSVDQKVEMASSWLKEQKDQKIKFVVLKWMAFSTRKDLEKIFERGAANERHSSFTQQ